MRSDIRNPWAHCDFIGWTTTKYTDSFDLMGKFVKSLGLINQEENRILGDLNTWGTNGIDYLHQSNAELYHIDPYNSQHKRYYMRITDTIHIHRHYFVY